MTADERRSVLAKLMECRDMTNKEAGKRLKVTTRTISKARRIELQATEASLQRILDGRRVE